MLNAGRDMYLLAKDKNPNARWFHLEGGDHGLQNRDDEFMEEMLGFLGAKQPGGERLDSPSAAPPASFRAACRTPRSRITSPRRAPA